jgi:hypothetical protein
VSHAVRPGRGRGGCPLAGEGNGSRAWTGSVAAGACTAQRLGQQQLQRQRAAPRDPAVRVEVSAKCASMPTRTAVHTSAVNFTSAMWMSLHLFRCIRAMKGLCWRCRGDMGSIRAGVGTRARSVADTPGAGRLERVGTNGSARTSRLERVGTRSNSWASFPVREGDPIRNCRLLSGRCQVYADLNTFRIALVPQSE